MQFQSIEIRSRACLDEVDPPVTRGLDPRVHLLRTRMDCRVKPGNDAGRISTEPALPPESPNPLIQLIKERNRAPTKNGVGTGAVGCKHRVRRMRNRHAGDRILLFIQVVSAWLQYLSIKDIQNEKLIG